MNITLNPQLCYTTPHNKIKNQTSPSFQSNLTRISNGQTPHFTYFFRDDFHWKDFAKYLERHFKNAKKVNIYNAACSDGTEPFTLLMSLFNKLGHKKSEKYLPIKAFDINEDLIKNAQTGEIPLLPQPYILLDIFKLKFKNFFLDSKFLKYKKNKPFGYSVQFNDKTRKHIDFKSGNILTEIPKMEGKNSVVMCRNMWMYLDNYEQEVLAGQLGRHLEKDSIVVLGEYDITASRAVELLEKNGFEETYIDKVFEKLY